MIKMFKASVSKMLKLLRVSNNTGSRIAGGYVIKSNIARPELIDKTAKIQYSQLKKNVSIGPNSLINKAFLDGNIKVGKNTTINGPGTDFFSINNFIEIGNFCSIARGTAIQEPNHNINAVTTYFIKYRLFGHPFGADVVSKGDIKIGNDVWIGTQSTILSGVTVGDGAVIAANSVVTTDVPPYAVVGGTPAKVLKYRFNDEIIATLLELRWWEWSDEKIKQNFTFFDGELTSDKFALIK